MKRHLKALTAAAALALALPASATAAVKEYMLDAHAVNPATPGVAGPAVTSAPLTSGVFYVAEVEGTISYYVKQMWTSPFAPFDDICGDTESKPKFFSPGVPEGRQGQVGMDAETVFARPCGGRAGSKTPPIGHWANFEINSGDGTGYKHIETDAGRLATPSWSHAYDYVIKGSGLPAKFRLLDLAGKTRDNYGRLKIDVRPATFHDCGDGGNPTGYAAFGFPTYDDCWAYMWSGAQDADTYVAAVANQQAVAKRKSARR